MDLTQLTPYVVAANFILTWAFGFFVHLVNRNKATNDRIERLETETQKRFGQHSDRIARLEVILEKAPTHDDLGILYEKLNETGNLVSRMAGQIDQMNDNVRLLLHNMVKAST
jgi:hypothetical protein